MSLETVKDSNILDIDEPTRVVCGWDVGIKTLSYCVIIKTTISNQLININSWGEINLADPTYICDGQLNSKQTKSAKAKKILNPINTDNINCKCTAKFYYTDSNNLTKYYCLKHKSQHKTDINIEQNTIKLSTKSKVPCEYLSTKNIQCNKASSSKIYDINCCTSHKKNIITDKVKQSSLKPIIKTKCASIDPNDLCDRLYLALNEKIDIFRDVEEIKIENQPALKNPLMKTVSAMLFAYFVFISQLNKQNMRVKFVSPGVKIDLTPDLIEYVQKYISNHLKEIANKAKPCKCDICGLNKELPVYLSKTESGLKHKFVYDSVKLLGILYTQKLLIDNNLYDKFDMIKCKSIKKLDDPCDAFLHAYKRDSKTAKKRYNDQ